MPEAGVPSAAILAAAVRWAVMLEAAVHWAVMLEVEWAAIPAAAVQ